MSEVNDPDAALIQRLRAGVTVIGRSDHDGRDILDTDAEEALMDEAADRLTTLIASLAEAEARSQQAMAACRIIDAAVKAGHSDVSELAFHLLEAVEPARAALTGAAS